MAICATHRCFITRPSRAVQMFNADCILNETVHQMSVHVKSFYRPPAGHYREQYIDNTIDVCAIHVDAQSSMNVFAKIVLSYYVRYTNANHTCPFVGSIVTRDVVIDANSVMNAWLPSGMYRVDLRYFESTTNRTQMMVKLYLTL